MFGKSKNDTPQWTVRKEFLYDKIADKNYKLTNTHSCFNEALGQVSVWYLGRFLVTIPCDVKLYNKALAYYPKCDNFIRTDFEFTGVDSDGELWVLKDGHLQSVSNKSLNLAGLRFEKIGKSLAVLNYGVNVLNFTEADIETLEEAKASYLDRKYLRLPDEKLAELFDNPLEIKMQRDKKLLNTIDRKIMVTTETFLHEKIEKRIEIVTAELAFGMNIFKDIFAAFSDFFGGRNKSIQNALREAKETVLLELKREAYRVGGDAVVGVDLDYSEISGGGKSMLFIVASGTAVKLKK
ncbi:YbjQ family protein [Aliiglaciecola sp. NS0011-25]|uniref:YbjQ family protein n=1 Tax=Aliiglaciecola sp. NS0011-25 TaxID=3127654 RepID=UPI003106B807